MQTQHWMKIACPPPVPKMTFSQTKVYWEILAKNEMTAETLSEALGISRDSAYQHLATMNKKGILTVRYQQIGKSRVAFFSVNTGEKDD